VSKPPLGLILVHKPANITSFKVLSQYKRHFETPRVGHTGTLDRFASGLMVVLIGQATRLSPFITLADKEYLAEFHFGRATDTFDPEGRPTGSGAIPTLTAIDAAIPALIGDLQQIPPDFSAVHVQGKRAYQRALAGEPVVLAPRPVRVESFEIVGWQPPILRVRIACSKGTYIRSLARDLAASLGTVAHVSALLRTKVGPFGLDAAHSPDSVLPPPLVTGWQLVPALPDFQAITVDDEQARLIGLGTKIAESWLSLPANKPSTKLAFLNSHEQLIGLAATDELNWRYLAVFN
jgi:tRNA pseudouridine55 synthase